MDKLCKEIADEHGLSREETLSLIENTLSETLTDALEQKVIACFDANQLRIFRSDGCEGLFEFPTEKIRREVTRLFRYRLNTELQRRKSSAEHEYLKTLRGKVVRGTIDRVMENGFLSVIVFIQEIFSCREMLGICPVANQPLRERGSYHRGNFHFFFVSRVRLVQEGSLFRNEIILSRTTPRLTEALLIKKTGHNGIRCVRRIAGKISMVISETRLPRESIIAVGEELGERIKVRCSS